MKHVAVLSFFVCPAGMWIGLRDAAASGHPITGIMNPSSGPLADEGSERAYQNFLRDVMGLGDAATSSDTAKPTVLRLVKEGGWGGLV